MRQECGRKAPCRPSARGRLYEPLMNDTPVLRQCSHLYWLRHYILYYQTFSVMNNTTCGGHPSTGKCPARRAGQALRMRDGRSRWCRATRKNHIKYRDKAARQKGRLPGDPCSLFHDGGHGWAMGTGCKYFPSQPWPMNKRYTAYSPVIGRTLAGAVTNSPA